MADTIKILIVDDEPYLLDMYRIKLSLEGYEVATASDGEQALELLNEEKPDLILLDIIMPKMDGFETLEKIKANPNLKDVPVIMLTNLNQDSDVLKSKELGALDFIVKANFTPTEVASKIRKYLNQ